MGEEPDGCRTQNQILLSSKGFDNKTHVLFRMGFIILINKKINFLIGRGKKCTDLI